MDRNFKIQKTKLLAVEGKDECNFFEAFFKYFQLDNIQTIDIGGKDRFKNEFPLLYAMEGFSELTHIGFVRDAETNPAHLAFASICNILKEYNLPCPSTINEIIKNNIAVGIFIMPDNQGTGMLENLCLKSIKNKPVQSCIDAFIDCFKKIQVDEEKGKFNEPKSRVQSYLASRSPIVKSLGEGALKKYWDFNHPCFSDIKLFLTQLFNEEHA